MKRSYCDRCGVEIKDQDSLRFLEISKYEGETLRPAIPAMDICVFCLEELKPIILKEKTT